MGIVSHYIGDACQPLHGSMLSDGYRNKAEPGAKGWPGRGVCCGNADGLRVRPHSVPWRETSPFFFMARPLCVEARPGSSGQPSLNPHKWGEPPQPRNGHAVLRLRRPHYSANRALRPLYKTWWGLIAAGRARAVGQLRRPHGGADGAGASYFVLHGKRRLRSPASRYRLLRPSLSRC